MEAPRPLELTRLAAEHLGARGVEDPRLDAELLLAHVLGVRRLDLYLQFERPLEPAEVEGYREAVRRRGRREPLQYITGRADFRELTLAVDPRVLIPRPETEVLVGEALAWAATRGGRLRALDLGTGSGAIAISLLVEGAFEGVVATDISAAALEIAAVNAGAAGVADRLELRRGSLWDPIGPHERFDVIVSNPPYVAESARDSLQPEVARYEPGPALFAAEDGLAVLRGIAEGAGDRLEEGGLLAVEVGLGQAAAVAEWLRRPPFTDVRVAEDLTGRERVVLAVRD